MTDNSNISLAHFIEVFQNADCLYNKQQVEDALDKMALEITQICKDSNPLLLCLLNGGLGIFGQILTRLDFLLEVDYCHPTRYRGSTMGQSLQWKVKPTRSLSGRTVILIDDILDEGVTLSAVTHYCHSQSVKQLVTCVLINKQHNRKYKNISADIIGLQVDDRYVFGYGMDYKNYWRNASGIFAVND